MIDLKNFSFVKKLKIDLSKLIFAFALLATFSAGFIFAWLRGRAADAYISNNTPIKSYNQQAQPVIDKSCPIKAKRKKSGKSFYHLPGDISYKRLKATDCFLNETEAKAAGFIKAGTLNMPTSLSSP